MDIVYIALGVGLFAAFGLYAAFSEADLTMVIGILYAIGAIGVSIYMVVALLRPDKF